MRDVQRVSPGLTSSRSVGQASAEGDHGRYGRVVDDLPARPGPDRTHRHGAMAQGTSPVTRFDPYGHVQEHGIGNHPAAELERRAVDQVLRAGADFTHTDIGWLDHGVAFRTAPAHRKKGTGSTVVPSRMSSPGWMTTVSPAFSPSTISISAPKSRPS